MPNSQIFHKSPGKGGSKTLEKETSFGVRQAGGESQLSHVCVTLNKTGHTLNSGSLFIKGHASTDISMLQCNKR